MGRRGGGHREGLRDRGEDDGGCVGGRVDGWETDGAVRRRRGVGGPRPGGRGRRRGGRPAGAAERGVLVVVVSGGGGRARVGHGYRDGGGGGGVVPDQRGELWAFRSASRRAMAYAGGEALQTLPKWLVGLDGPKSLNNLGRKAFVGD